MSNGVAAAYDASGAAWADGPTRVYDGLADELCERSPAPLEGAQMLDLGAGTGAATRAGRVRGATVVAVDLALGMLAARPEGSGSATVGDAIDLPFRAGVFDAVIAAFSLNHLEDPARGLREATRVLRPGGGLVVAAYAEGDDHPVKAVTDAALTAIGWVSPPWYLQIKSRAVPLLATVERAEAVSADAGLDGARVDEVKVPFVDLDEQDLVAWRLGMAHIAPFVASLTPSQRQQVTDDAVARLGPHPPTLVRKIVVLTWQSAAVG